MIATPVTTTATAAPTSFSVSTGELDTFAAAVDGLCATLQQYLSEVTALELDDNVFGRLPGISSKVYDAYSRHLRESSTALDEGRQVLTDLSEAATATVAGYRDTETANLTLINELVAEIQPRIAGPVRSPLSPSATMTTQVA